MTCDLAWKHEPAHCVALQSVERTPFPYQFPTVSHPTSRTCLTGLASNPISNFQYAHLGLDGRGCSPASLVISVTIMASLLASQSWLLTGEIS